ncbi:MAG: hypothetical protein E4H36_07975 [Spirochaetales bacterium]|nr:MAG: hypothetical protein E4H36_07975 [Spirochaetales bacterium]
MKKNSLYLLLMIRLVPKKYENFLTLLQKTLSLLNASADLPGFCVHWNFPSYPLFEDKSDRGKTITAALRERIDEGRDLFLLQGYAGAFHRFLQTSELEKELEWALENPWKSGACDLFKDYPAAIMPLDVDFFRFSTKMLYEGFRNEKHHLPLVVAPGLHSLKSGDEGSRELFILHHDDIYSLPLLLLNETSRDMASALRRKTSKSVHPFVVFIDIENLAHVDTLGEFFLTLIKLLNKNIDISFRGLTDCVESLTPVSINREITAFTPHLSPDSGDITRDSDADALKDGGLAFFAGSTGIEDRFFLKDLTENREITDTVHIAFAQEGLRRLLVSSAVGLRQNPGVPDNKYPNSYLPQKRDIIANMPGTAVLNEPGFEAVFFEGRFRNIIFDGRPVTADLPVSSFLGKAPFVPVHDINAFAFEDESIRGMRETMTINLPGNSRPGSMTIDCYLVADNACLVVDIYASFPVFETPVMIEEYGIFDIPLFRLEGEDKVFLTGLYPDGEEYTITLDHEERTCSVNGSGFILSRLDTLSAGTPLSLTLQSYSGKIPMIFSVAVKVEKKDKKHSLVRINPFGSYSEISSQFISGMDEHITLVLSVTAGPDRGLRRVPEEVLSGFRPYWLVKRT